MGRQSARSHRVRGVDLPATSASKRSGTSRWVLVGATGLLLSLAAIARIATSDRPSVPAPDQVRIVTVGAGKSGRTAVYQYDAAPKARPSPGHGVALVSDIDDSSSEEAYQRSCLAALTRDSNPEIMALSEAARKDMCTDPRRR